ncbi:MAG: HDOD domain-containing protein [Burkholderiales bacterium]|nr:HDOD domain-containing protein [Burkholderiales bacterium]
MDELQSQRADNLKLLLERIEQDPGFTAMSSSVQTIVNLDEDGLSGNRELVVAVLRDFGLTAKLLRAANATSRGKNNVSNIDQAISVLGLNTVQNICAELPMLSSVENKAQYMHLCAEIAAAFFCGSLAAAVTRHNAPRYNAQEAQVCGVVQNLGRIAAYYYLYENVEKSHVLQAEKNLTEDEAITLTLGMGFDAIGTTIAHHWNLPDVLEQCIGAKMDKAPPRAANSAQGWHPVCSLFARCITDALFRMPEGRDKIAISHDLNFFHQALSLKNEDAYEWIEATLAEVDSKLQDMGFPVDIAHARMLLRKSSEKVLDSLSSQDSLTKANPRTGNKKPIDLIHQALRMLHNEFDFDLTLLCVPDGPAGLSAVSGVGRNANLVAPKFRCSGQRPDIFRLVMGKKVDLYVADVANPTYSRLLPEWYHGVVGGKSFLVWSLVVDGRFLGLLYADFSEPHPETPFEKTEGEAKKWRDVLCAALSSTLPPKVATAAAR